MNGNNYEVIKEVYVKGGSDIDGQYFVGGELSKEHALDIAKNLATVDMQVMNGIILFETNIRYKVINADTHKVVEVFEACENWV